MPVDSPANFDKVNPMGVKKVVPLFFSLAFLSACSHMNQKIQDLPLQATKTYILKTLGQPYKIIRKEGRDHWIYRFVIDGRHYTRSVIIREGALYRKGKIEPYSIRPPF